MRAKSLLLAGALSAAVAAGAAEGPESLEGVVNYRRLGSGIVSAGAVSRDAISGLKAAGFKTVIDLRTPAEGTDEERRLVEGEGLAYVSVPVTPASLSASDVERVRALLEDPAKGPVLLHCASGNRTGAVWAAIQAGRGLSLEAAEAAGRQAGLTSPAMVEAFRRVASEKAAAPPPRPTP